MFPWWSANWAGSTGCALYGDPVLARALVERVTSPGDVRDLVLGGTIAELLGSG
ncbi:hypothetical protein ACIP3D_12305 [Streptomyces longwoodensis]|uniref:hypothetical protein n=1 Tax=Streptomyces longwoodensis TaxID=68231 RepID=UPI00382CEFA3